MIEKTIYIDDWNRDQRSTNIFQRPVLQYTTDDFNAVDFVSMNCCADKQGRPRAFTPNNLHGDGKVSMRIHWRHTNINRLALTGIDGNTTYN